MRRGVFPFLSQLHCLLLDLIYLSVPLVSEVFIGGVLSPYALIGRDVSLYVKPPTPLFFSLNKPKGWLYFKRRTGKNRRTVFLEHTHITCRISSWKPFGAEGHGGYYYHCLHLHKGALRAGFKLQSTLHQLHCHKWGRKIYHETVRLYLFLWTLPGPAYLSTSGAFSFLHLPLYNCHGTGKLKEMLPAEAQWQSGTVTSKRHLQTSDRLRCGACRCPTRVWCWNLDNACPATARLPLPAP